MRRLRTLSSRRLIAIVAAVAVLAASAAIAQAGLIGGEPKPEPKALDRAILDAANAPAVEGISARIEFTNGLIPSGSLPGGGSSPLAAGADGRLWMARDGRFRLELQSESRRRPDRLRRPHAERLRRLGEDRLPRWRCPRSADRGRARARHARAASAAGSTASPARGRCPARSRRSTAGRPTYTVRIAPKDDGGLLGAGELAWDAVKGVPLRAAVYAQDAAEPVLELAATDVSFGRVPTATCGSPCRPARRRSTSTRRRAATAASRARPRSRASRPSSASSASELSAPRRAGGAAAPARCGSCASSDSNGALSVYGKGLGGILVLQHEASGDQGGRPESGLPQVNIDGATGTELATALGTMITSSAAASSYTVVGSVPPAAVENAARGLR